MEAHLTPRKWKINRRRANVSLCWSVFISSSPPVLRKAQSSARNRLCAEPRCRISNAEPQCSSSYVSSSYPSRSIPGLSHSSPTSPHLLKSLSRRIPRLLSKVTTIIPRLSSRLLDRIALLAAFMTQTHAHSIYILLNRRCNAIA